MASKTTILTLPEDELVHPGNRACAGCGLSIAYRIALKALGRDTILVVPPSCLTVLQGLYPIAATQLPCLNVTFASTAAGATGVLGALRALGNTSTTVAAWAGDGGTSDIGIQALSGACERGEDFIFFCYDNEAYMNTGVQRSGTTPQGAITTTTPFSGKRQQKKDVPSIIAAHGIGYVGPRHRHPTRWTCLTRSKRPKPCPGPGISISISRARRAGALIRATASNSAGWPWKAVFLTSMKLKTGNGG